MKFKSLFILIGIVLFIVGNIINLFFSSNLLWGEMEAVVFAPQTDAKKLQIDCPLMLAPSESGTIQASFINTTNNSTTPQVNAFISTQNGDVQVERETLELESLESTMLEWTVDSSDIVFDRLILISILQRPYRDLESRQGTCSIYVYSLFGMNGRNTLMTLTELGVLLSVVGIGLLHYLFHPLDGRVKKMMQVQYHFFDFGLTWFIQLISKIMGFNFIL